MNRQIVIIPNLPKFPYDFKREKENRKTYSCVCVSVVRLAHHRFGKETRKIYFCVCVSAVRLAHHKFGVIGWGSS